MKEHLGGCVINNDMATWAPQVWDRIVEDEKISSVIDVGCGAGHSLKYFLDMGLYARGIEGYLEAINNSKVKEFIYSHDYIEGPFVLDRNYDLAWCCEFVEHVEEKYSDNFMETFKMCRLVAMTHALPGQPGHHHVNCQNAKYWIDRFDKIGFSYMESYSFELRETLPNPHQNQNGNDRDGNGGWVKNSLMVFSNREK